MLTEEEICALAKQIGFHDAAFMDVADLVIKPEYRKYCEMNLCGQYDVNPYCPPKCGTMEELWERMNGYKRALILQSLHDEFAKDVSEAGRAKTDHNHLADRLMADLAQLQADGHNDQAPDILRMSVGAWKGDSCLSAYCIDAQCMAESVGMQCWADDGKNRYFSLILFK